MILKPIKKRKTLCFLTKRYVWQMVFSILAFEIPNANGNFTSTGAPIPSIVSAPITPLTSPQKLFDPEPENTLIRLPKPKKIENDFSLPSFSPSGPKKDSEKSPPLKKTLLSKDIVQENSSPKPLTSSLTNSDKGEDSWPQNPMVHSPYAQMLKKEGILNSVARVVVKSKAESGSWPSPRALVHNKENLEENVKKNSSGSAFCIQKQNDAGFFATNYHVIQDCVKNSEASLHIVLSNGKKYPASLMAVDQPSDLALLRVDLSEQDAQKIQPLIWGDSNQMDVGDYVLAVGFPHNLGVSVSLGIISCKDRNLREKGDPTTHVNEWLQTDASISVGSSGGPMLNVLGQVVGVNTLFLSQSGDNAGISLAIPSRLAREILSALFQRGHVQRGYLGIAAAKRLKPYDAKDMGIPFAYGVVVNYLHPDYPAHNYLCIGDVILELDGVQIESPFQMRKMVSEKIPGSKVKLKVWRFQRSPLTPQKDQNIVTIDLPVSDYPDPLTKNKDSQGKDVEFLGIRAKSAASEMHRYDSFNQFGIYPGVRIDHVEAHSPLAGKLQEKDLILRINQKIVEDTPSFQKIFRQILESQSSDGMTMEILRIRPDGVVYYEIVRWSFPQNRQNLLSSMKVDSKEKE